MTDAADDLGHDQDSMGERVGENRGTGSEETEDDESDCDDSSETSSSDVDDGLDPCDQSGESDGETEWEDDGDEPSLEDAQQPLYPGAPLTRLEHTLAILSLLIRLDLTGILLAKILSLLALHCPKPNLCITSLYKFKKIFNIIKTPIKRHFYYSVCFLSRDRPDESNCVKCFLANPDNLSFMWNTDGFPLFKSSKISIWPFFLVINELPYHLRYKKENMLLAGLWFGPTKPEANLFMNSFRKCLRELYKEVTMVILDTAIKIRAVIICGTSVIICGTCDLPAKAHFLNMKLYSGFFGCKVCKLRGERLNGVQNYPYSRNCEMRNTDESLKQAEEALEKHKDKKKNKKEPNDVCGVKGPTGLAKIVYKYIETTAIDVMHCAYVGLTKRLGTFWFGSEHHDQAFSLTRFLTIINKRLSEITPPNFVTRLPRSISDIAYWKAFELKVFLLTYSLPLLHDIMDQRYFNHHTLLVYGLYLLNQESISTQMIDLAEKLLNEYVSQFGLLYGDDHMNCNLHLLLHLPEIVRCFGPLWVVSCFPFENMNGVLKKLVHGTKYAETQICSSVALFLDHAELKRKYSKEGSPVHSFCIDLESSRRLKVEKISKNIFAVGKLKKSLTLSDSLLYCFRNIEIDAQKVHIFHRLLMNGRVIDCSSYNRNRKTRSSVVKYTLDGVLHTRNIDVFVKVCQCACGRDCEECEVDVCQSYAIVRKYETSTVFECDVAHADVPFILSSNQVIESTRAIPVACIDEILFEIRVKDKVFIVQNVNNIQKE
ncbi:hypothetical protein QAD02_002365 [Eretmocerus hayati]|uniref:Uncharacterized protein n=1 Tax=Eretmocerus hayati TaxID=131215 RepID=A0ACC2NJ40_9HYME|nr:hypothetical protein QAD02_002365 [Eretmocerus hayati]